MTPQIWCQKGQVRCSLCIQRMMMEPTMRCITQYLIWRGVCPRTQAGLGWTDQALRGLWGHSPGSLCLCRCPCSALSSFFDLVRKKKDCIFSFAMFNNGRVIWVALPSVKSVGLSAAVCTWHLRPRPTHNIVACQGRNQGLQQNGLPSMHIAQ